MASGRQLCWVLGCVAVVLSAFVAEPHVANGRNTYRSALEKKARVLDSEKWSLRQSLPAASFDRRPAGPPQVREEAGQDKSHVNPALLYGCSWLSSGFWEIKLAKIGLRQPNKLDTVFTSLMLGAQKSDHRPRWPPHHVAAAYIHHCCVTCLCLYVDKKLHICSIL